MSWLKKRLHVVSKSLRRMRHGKFHLNPFRNNSFITADPVGWSHFRTLPKRWRKNMRDTIDWGRLKKKYRKLVYGDNSAQSVYFYDSGSGYVPGGYQYNGRTLSQLTGGR